MRMGSFVSDFYFCNSKIAVSFRLKIACITLIVSGLFDGVFCPW